MSETALLRYITLVITALCLHPTATHAQSTSPLVSVVYETSSTDPVLFGISQLTNELQQQSIPFEKVHSLDACKGSIIVLVGLTEGSAMAAVLAKKEGQSLPEKPESYRTWETSYKEKRVIAINGTDSRGLMYGILSLVDEAKKGIDSGSLFKDLPVETVEPEVVTRAISIYTMNRAYWESRFYDEDYWKTYMDLLAKNRFNSIVVIFGYENAGFLAPSYPYFFDVDGYPQVKMKRITASEQERNLNALNRLIDLAHERGLQFKVGIWDHIYRGGVQAGGLTEEELATFDQGHMVEGLDAENLPDYTKAALTKFIEKVPDLDGIQFRMHNESGLKRGEEMAMFWNEIFTMIKKVSPDFQIDLRAKELPESIIQVAKDLDLNFTITTKYWMEQMGLPFHPTHINRENQHDRRHGYADMLRYPRQYDIHWRMWNGGTHRLLLWGNPDYVRRFIESTHLYDGKGYEVNEPLATKMEAQPHDEEPFDILSPPYQYYQYEFERYWHFYQLFGRLGYDLNTSPEIWHSEFEHRFGRTIGPLVEEALHEAGWVLPMIVAACSPYGKFPTTRGWAEKQRYGDLPQYAMAEGSDIQQFASFDTEAQLLIEGGVTAKRLPSVTSAWFKEKHRILQGLIAEIRNEHNPENKELRSTLTDLEITANLALYHAYRIPAAVSYRIYKRTDDPHALDDAIAYEKKALAAWKGIVQAAGDVYASNLKFGMSQSVFVEINHHLSGHWKDELEYLKEGLEDLESERKKLSNKSEIRIAPTFQNAATPNVYDQLIVKHMPVLTAPANQSMTIRADIKALAEVKSVHLRYRSVNQTLDYKSLPMTPDASGIYEVTIPAEELDPTFDFMYFFEVLSRDGKGCIYPNLDNETPYYIVKLNQ